MVRWWRGRRGALVPITLLALVAQSASLHAYDLTDWLSIGGVAAAGGQCQLLTDSADATNECRGALPAQPELSIRPTDRDELFVKAGFAAGNGLNEVSPFTLATWAADLNNDVKNINGRYDYLLNAWYKHEFAFGTDPTGSPETTVGITGGIIDSTDYLDTNAYADDEYTQFMQEAFGSGARSFLPAYDVGGVVELDTGPWSVRGVVMNIGENEDGNSFMFGGAQVGYTADTAWGEGNYRLFLAGTGKDFLNPEGTREASRIAGGLSFDQELGETFGAFLRLGWQAQSAAVDYAAAYTGGINILGAVWGRPDDNIGLGYGYLSGGNLEVNSTHVAEVYYRLVVNKILAVTFDAQYMKDNVRDEDGPAGFVLGLRGTAQF